MIAIRRPTEADVERYRADREHLAPTFRTPGATPPEFHSAVHVAPLGRDPELLDRATAALRAWSVHRGAGVRPTPRDAPLEVGATVALVTRQLGLWILAACRITDVVDTATSFGFTYATLPGHPECGEESFTIETAPDGATTFAIAVTWRSDA
ncbi:MAG TPA: DUF1990 domain-containing protein, partial [Microthrixaceae bacterium]|nr:DUF1990 domain-containing protein [Microthrixaceae bacterium]